MPASAQRGRTGSGGIDARRVETASIASPASPASRIRVDVRVDHTLVGDRGVGLDRRRASTTSVTDPAFEKATAESEERGEEEQHPLSCEEEEQALPKRQQEEVPLPRNRLFPVLSANERRAIFRH